MIFGNDRFTCYRSIMEKQDNRIQRILTVNSYIDQSILKCKKQLTEAKESGKLIWLSQRNDSFEETT